jgi:signal transduction histidine kinase
VLDDAPEEARASLQPHQDAGRAALTELRDVVVLLRAPDEPAAPTAPTGGLADLDALVAAFGRSGMRVGSAVVGVPQPVPDAVGRTAYRVVQEALTNVAKHAGGAGAVVRLSYTPRRLEVVVDDDGPGTAAAAGTGHGVAGMRERVAAVGGRLEAGPGPERGFRVPRRCR